MYPYIHVAIPLLLRYSIKTSLKASWSTVSGITLLGVFGGLLSPSIGPVWFTPGALPMNAFNGSTLGVGVEELILGASSAFATAALREAAAVAVGVTPHRLHTQPPAFVAIPWLSAEPFEDLDTGRSAMPMLDRRYDVLLCPFRERVGRAIVIDELSTGSVDVTEMKGLNWPRLGRG